MGKVSDWLPIEFDVDATSRKVIKAFERWYKDNITVTNGSGRNAEEIFGLPYTSSSDYAALWNCQGEAYLNEDPQWKFNALAIRDTGEILAVFDREDTGNFDELELVIGRLKERENEPV